MRGGTSDKVIVEQHLRVKRLNRFQGQHSHYAMPLSLSLFLPEWTSEASHGEGRSRDRWSTYRDSAMKSDPLPIRCELTKAVVSCSVCLTSSAGGTAISPNMTRDRGGEGCWCGGGGAEGGGGRRWGRTGKDGGGGQRVLRSAVSPLLSQHWQQPHRGAESRQEEQGKSECECGSSVRGEAAP